MKKTTLLFAHLLSLFATCIGQNMQVTSTGAYPFDIEYAVRQYFSGSGVIITSVAFSGDQRATGYFQYGQNAVAIQEGLLLTTGSVASQGPSTGAAGTGMEFASFDNNNTATSSNLALISGVALQDVAKLVISFIPLGDTIRFDYVFASEEYPEYACTQFNDIFGFFIEGPGYSVPLNIAIIPGTNLPVAINNIHPFNDQISLPDSCPPFNDQYYHSNVNSSAQPVYDGFTDVFRAQAAVIPCATYTMEITIADIGDGVYDSAVFLKSKSFSANALQVTQRTAGTGSNIGEGCVSAQVSLGLPHKATQAQSIPYGIIGNAANGVDYSYLSGIATVPVGDSMALITIQTIEDQITEPGETVGIVIPISPCRNDTVWFVIQDYLLHPIDLPDTWQGCFTLDATAVSPVSAGEEIAFQNLSNLIIDPDGAITYAEIDVSGIPNAYPDSSIIKSICINVDHGWDGELDIWLYAPNGNALELSTGNGASGGDYSSTCFSPDAILPIALPGQSAPSSAAPFTGKWRPEGRWGDLFNNLDNVNGKWKLAIKDQQVGNNGTLLDWSITFAPGYQVYYEWSPQTGLSCGNCPIVEVTPSVPTLYHLTVSDNYGCLYADSVFVGSSPNCLPSCNNAGTFSLGNFSGQSNDISLDTIFLCKGDSIRLLHHGDADLSGDPAPSTSPGLTFAFYQCHPTINGPTLSNLIDDPCAFPNYLVSTQGFLNGGQTYFWNQSQSQIFFANGDPVLLWFALVTYDGLLGGIAGYESVTTGEPPGPCVNVNMADAFAVVYLNEIKALNATVGSNLSGNFTVQGGLPEWDGSDYQIDIRKVNNPSITGWVTSGTTTHSGMVTFQVPEEGEYEVIIEDGKSCRYTFTLNFNSCALGVQIQFTQPSCFGSNDGSVTAVVLDGGNIVTLPNPDYSFDWSINVPDPGNYIQNNIPWGQYSVSVTALSSGCTSQALGTLGQPSPILASVSPTPACEGSNDGAATLMITGGIPPFQYYASWSGTSVPVVGNTAVINNLSAGNYNITISDLNGCTSGSYSVSVGSNPLPDIVTSDGVISCLTNIGQLSASSSMLDATYTWIGPDNFTATGPSVNAWSAGTYTVVVTNPSTGCSNSSTATLVGDPSLPLANAGPDRSACIGQTVTLVAESGGSDFFWSTGDNFVWSIKDTIQLQNSTCLILTVTGDNGCITRDTVCVLFDSELHALVSGNTTPCITTTGTVLVASGGDFYDWGNGFTNDSLWVYPQNTSPQHYSVTISNSDGCVDSLIVSVNPQTTAMVDIEGTETICLGTSTTLIANGNSNTSLFRWDNNSQSPQRIVSPTATTEFWVIGSTSSTNCPDTARFSVNVSHPPVANAGPDQTVCDGEAQLHALLPPNSGAGTWTVLNQSIAIVDPYAPLTMATGLETGANRFVWQVASAPCPGTPTDTLVITLDDRAPVANDDQVTILPDDMAEFSPLSNDSTAHLSNFSLDLIEQDDNGAWSLSANGTLRFDPNSGFDGDALAKYILCNAFCPDICAEANIRVRILDPKDDIGETQVITPNEDGKNETLIFDYLDKYPDNAIVIFNRWGQRVYDAKPYPNNEMDGWHGKYNGKPLPAGTYYYILNLKGEDEYVWGNVLIVR
jgi:gliding motility-associated-like protein